MLWIAGLTPAAHLSHNGTTHLRMKRNSTHPSLSITSARRLTKLEGGSTHYWLLVQLSLENRHTRDVFPLAISWTRMERK